MKTVAEFLQIISEVQGGIRAQYSSDSKLVPDGNGGYRKVRARRIKVGDIAPNPSMIDAPDVGDNDAAQDKNRVVDIYKKYFKKYSQSIKPIVRKDVQQEETIEEVHQEDPPYILVLKRQNVRQYPNNVKIALYYNEKLGKHFSVPYGPGVSGEIQAEQNDVQKSLLLNILNTFSKLNEENQQLMLEKICEDEDAFNKIIEFSLKNNK